MSKKVKNPEIAIIVCGIICIVVTVGNAPLAVRIPFGVIGGLLLLFGLITPVNTLKDYLVYRRQVRKSKSVLMTFYEEHGFVIEDADAFLPGARKKDERLKIRAYSSEDIDLPEVIWEYEFKANVDTADVLLVWNLDVSDSSYNRVAIPDVPEKIECSAASEDILYFICNKVTRNNLRLLLKLTDAFSINDNSIDVRLPQKTTSSTENLKRLDDACRSIAERVSGRYEMHSRIRETALDDPFPEFRRSAIACYGKNYGGYTTKTKSYIDWMLTQALLDPVLVNQLEAAKWLDKKGLIHINKLLEESLTVEEENAAAEALYHHKNSRSIELLWSLFEKTENKELQLGILSNLANAESTDLSDAIVSRLNNKDKEILVALIRVLGRCGTLKAVEPLYRLGQKSRSRNVDGAVNQAIASIQERHGRGDGGWLSVSEMAKESGALSLDKEEDMKGMLSDVKKKQR